MIDSDGFFMQLFKPVDLSVGGSATSNQADAHSVPRFLQVAVTVLSGNPAQK
jgi:hypothetical protein